MKLLIENDNERFKQYTNIYEENFSSYLKYYQDEIKNNNFLNNLPPSVQNDRWDPSVYVQWPIRKLEYSFMLHNCNNFLKAGMKTLDAGCGLTPTARWFASQGCESYGVDFDEKTIQYLQNPKSYLHDPKLNLSTQDITNLKFDDSSFDIVTSISVLEHLPPGSKSTKQAISESLRVLRPGGKFILTVDFRPKGSTKTKRGLDLLKKGKVKEFTKKLTRNISSNPTPKVVRIQHGAYNSETIMKEIIEPFRNYFEENSIQRIDVDRESIRQFWTSHWWPGCQYDKKVGRLYVSVGMVFRKHK